MLKRQSHVQHNEIQGLGYVAVLIPGIFVADESLSTVSEAEKLTPKKRRVRQQLFLHELIPSVSTCLRWADPGC